MKTLNAPLFELNQESPYYKILIDVKDSRPKINEILSEVASTVGYDSKDFAYYGSHGFGFNEYSNSAKKFETELTKKADRNGILRFKKASKSYKIISPRVREIEKITEKINPFELHDMFGWNNVVASHWLGDRYFVEVKSASMTTDFLTSDERKKRYEIEPVKNMDYKDYLILATSLLEKA